MRQSPNESATIFEIGTKKKGNDGNMWIVSKLSSGIKRWKKVNAMPTKGKKYTTHDNGNRPFRVIVDKDNVHIYTYHIDDEDDNDEEIYDNFIKSYKVKKVFIGKSITGFPIGDHKKKDSKYFDGNSILLQITSNKYVFIGDTIYEFLMNNNDKVEKYYSMVGHSDVPYPIILGENNVYFMLDRTYVNRDEFPIDMKNRDYENAYSFYFGHATGEKLSDFSHKMKGVKLIHDRVF